MIEEKRKEKKNNYRTKLEARFERKLVNMLLTAALRNDCLDDILPKNVQLSLKKIVE